MNRNEKIILLFFFLLYLIWFAIPVAVVGTDDFRMVDAFNVDESQFLQLLKNEVKSHTFNMRFYAYSHLYFNTGLVPLILADFVFPVTEQHIIILYRLLSALFFLGTIVVVFLTGKKFFGKITAWLSVILMFTISSQLFVYSTMFHPDTAQLFFISLSIFFCCSYFNTSTDRQWKFLAWSAFTAGLAFGTKYAGIMLMPLIVGIDVLEKKNIQKTPSLRSWLALVFCLSAAILLNKNWLVKYIPFSEISEGFYLLIALVRVLAIGAGAFILFYTFFYKKISALTNSSWIFSKSVNAIMLTAIFLGAFAISSPGCLRGLNFISGFLTVTDLARYGHWFNTPLGISGWMGVLLLEGVFDRVVFVLFFLNIIVAIINGIKYGLNHIACSLILLFWPFIYLTILILKINADFSHYLFPVIPFFIIMAAHSVETIVNYFSKKFPGRANLFIVIIPLLLLGYSVFNSSLKIISTRNLFTEKVLNSEAVKAGLWAEENFPGETRILYDRYAYVHTKFSNCFPSWGITEKQIAETMPRLVILNSQIYQNFLNPENAASFLWGKEEYLEKFNCYKSLLDGVSDYKLLKDFGKIKVFSSTRELKKQILFHSFNDYESISEKWLYRDIISESAEVFSGSKAEKLVGEYSSTFSAPLSEIFNDTIKNPRFFFGSVRARLSGSSSAMLIIDFYRDGKSLAWKGNPINNSNPGQWQKSDFARQVPEDALPTDEVKIYVWHESGESLLLDDFKVEAYTFE